MNKNLTKEQLTQKISLAKVAVAEAQAGNFDLLDALEFRNKDRRSFNIDGRAYTLLYGIWEGGRLQRFAYGTYDDEYFEFEDIWNVFFIVDFNGNVLYDKNALIDWTTVSQLEEDRFINQVFDTEKRDLFWADSVVRKYKKRMRTAEAA